ncbi:Squamous cell carcinoma antigen recognized by T-cells 3 [Eumeta japonica]|uniref:Squamous cell carcinoma antigen recognized by T-cells 3 n=1 Tax=Eumeta variegata TaxID=151549 RepID=A0A4C1VL51_EUMVA|nr:Squamous cell carcinoma antigen recognized by T-cells 3 [Eumeta japonica]
MAIVEDEVRNESGEENEIEVVVEEDDGEEQDSADEDSDDDGSDDEEMLETKVAMLEQRVTENPYNYDDHIELIQALWRSSELDRWREAFNRLQKMSLVSSEHWVMRLQTESSLAHSQADIERIADLFQQALLDCFTLSVLTEWCTWALHLSDIEFSRKQLEDIVKRAGADPLSGKIFWDAKKEFETTQLETMSEDEPGYKEQVARILYCVEEVVSRPLLHHDESWAEFEEWATKVKDKEYIEKVKLQHEAAADFLEKITRFEDKLLTLVDPEEKCDVYQEYISMVKQLAEDSDKYGECDVNGILKVLYERSTSDCLTTERCYDLCAAFIEHVHAHSSRSSYKRAVEACTRRQPHVHKFWTSAMRQAEKDGKEFDEIKSILETALSRGMKSFKEADFLWMSYLESVRRHTDFEDPSSVDRLRRTFRLAWDSLAEAWGAAADESFVPIYWARVEYTRVRDHVRGREIFEEAITDGRASCPIPQLSTKRGLKWPVTHSRVRSSN